jgi:LAO/AO transport system kinase
VRAGEGGGGGEERWTPPVVKCVATRGEGIEAVTEALDRHRAWVDGTEAGRARRKARLAEEVRDALREAMIEAAAHDLAAQIDAAVRDVDARAVDPYTATERLVEAFRARG